MLETLGLVILKNRNGVKKTPSLLDIFCLKDRCGLSCCNRLASCPEGCMAKLLHASKTGDNLLSMGTISSNRAYF